MTNSPYVHPLTLAYYVCAKTGWTIGSQRLNYILYITAMCYAGETGEMLVPNLFEIDYPILSPVNKAVTRVIGYQKIVRKYNISLFPPSISVPSEGDFGIDEDKRKFIDSTIAQCMKKTNGELFRIGITGRNDRKGKFIDCGQLSLEDMIRQYDGIVALSDKEEQVA